MDKGKRMKFISLIKGVVLVVFGLWLLQSPVESLHKLISLLGVFVLAGGIIELLWTYKNSKIMLNSSWWWFNSIFEILFGAFLMANPDFMLALISFIISLVLFVWGVMNFIFVANSKIQGSLRVRKITVGTILVLLAIMFLWHPDIISSAISIWAGLSLIFLGIFRILLLTKINNPKDVEDADYEVIE